MIWILLSLAYLAIGFMTSVVVSRHDTYSDLDEVELTFAIVFWPIVWGAVVVGFIFTAPGAIVKKITG